MSFKRNGQMHAMYDFAKRQRRDMASGRRPNAGDFRHADKYLWMVQNLDGFGRIRGNIEELYREMEFFEPSGSFQDSAQRRGVRRTTRPATPPHDRTPVTPPPRGSKPRWS